MKDCNHDSETYLSQFRKSKNLDSVMSIFYANQTPMCAEEIFKQAKDNNKSLALSTVYRILDKLVTSGIIHETLKDNDKAFYELVADSHKHYMICTECKKLIPIDMCPFLELEQQIQASTGFKITGHKFEIYGKCPQCQ